MLGIVIGIGAVIAMISIGRGAQQQINKELQSLGSNLLFVQNGVANTGSPASQGAGSATTLTWEDAQAIARSAQSVKAVAPLLNSRTQVVSTFANTNTALLGTTPDYVTVQDFLPLTGRFFHQGEVKQAERVAVLGQSVVKTLGMTPENAIGKTIRIRGEAFRVIGTLEYKGSSQFRDQDDVIILPLTTLAQRIVGVNALNGIALSSITVSYLSADQMEAAKFQITNLLRLRHKIVPPNSDDFSVSSQQDLLNTVNEVTGIFTLLLAATAAISLVVGGIGIMNIMLVSVSERTREIGVRKAVGARSGDILWQFLFEAIVLAFSGGLLGIVLGIGAALLISLLLGWATSISPESVLLACGVCLGIGITFGVYPARRAASLDPAVALRID
ncbi:MAG: ABC transporter permease [Anaerolineae bacterium]|nr:ABC transporter permease [Gloeobacterales cyanobacterium ES-bin-313]